MQEFEIGDDVTVKGTPIKGKIVGYYCGRSRVKTYLVEWYKADLTQVDNYYAADELQPLETVNE